MSTLSTTNIKHPSSASNNIVLDSSGRVGIGTSSALTGTNSANGILTIKGYPGTPSSAAIFNLARGLDSTSVSSGNALGRIVFADQQAGEYAFIEGVCDGTPGVGDYPGRLVFSTTADAASSPTEQMRLDSSGNLKFNSGFGSVGTAYGVRAWVNFNASSGTPTINNHGNISSITDNGVGQYTFNFTNSFPDANYVMVPNIQAGTSGINDGSCFMRNGDKTTSSHSVSTTNSSQSSYGDQGRNDCIWVR